MSVYWAILSERQGAANDMAFNSMLDLAVECGKHADYKRLPMLYTATDVARNTLVENFLAVALDPNDCLVMLDGDHYYPANFIEEMAGHEAQLGVVGALAFRRGDPYDPLFFIQSGDSIYSPAKVARGNIYECHTVSTSAICIRRWVFDELAKHSPVPYFRYVYNDNMTSRPSEDMYFGKMCAAAGIHHYCDTALEIPHLTRSWITHVDHDNYVDAHPELIEAMR